MLPFYNEGDVPRKQKDLESINASNFWHPGDSAFSQNAARF